MAANIEKALEIFDGGFNCAQAVLISRAEELGLGEEAALRVAGGFGGGMGHIGGACGAFTGALMLIGLKYGKVRADDAEAKERTYAKVKEYADMFKAKYGSIMCKDLIEFDLSVHEELVKAREAGVFKTICPLLVRNSIELVEKVL